MNASPDARQKAARAVQDFATQLRESAQANIVASFRTYLEGGGNGPTDNELKIFARLTAYEHRIRNRPLGGGLPVADAAPAEGAEAESLALRAPVAYGDLVDLARYRHGIEGEVCAACQTVNARGAKFCKGCAGRLPAFYALSAPASSEKRPEPQPVAAQAAPARTPWFARSRRVLVSSTVFASALLLALSAALGPWAGGSSSANAPSRSGPVVSAVEPTPAAAPVSGVTQAAVTESAPPAIAQAAPGTTDTKTNPPLQATASEDPPVAPAGAAMVPLRKPQPKLASAPARNAPRALARGTDSWGPVASCGGLNFFSRAVCVNNVCAQPGMSRSGQCVDAVRQRRLDEARRNPTLMG